MVIALEDVKRKQRNYLIGGGLSMLVIRKLLWNRGYFAHFFFHTRFQPFIYMMIAYSFISLNFTENLKKNDVYFYYTNRRRTEQFNKLTKETKYATIT